MFRFMYEPINQCFKKGDVVKVKGHHLTNKDQGTVIFADDKYAIVRFPLWGDLTKRHNTLELVRRSK